MLLMNPFLSFPDDEFFLERGHTYPILESLWFSPGPGRFSVVKNKSVVNHMVNRQYAADKVLGLVQAFGGLLIHLRTSPLSSADLLFHPLKSGMDEPSSEGLSALASAVCGCR